MAEVRILPRADLDLEEAITWLRSRSLQAARRFEDTVEQAIDRIAAIPEMYALVDEQHRLCPVRKSQYVIVYRYDSPSDEVIVVAVVDARRDPRSWASGF